MNHRTLVILAAGVLLLSLLLHFPANVATGLLGLDEVIAMEGVSGTVWNGGATSASVDDMHLGRLRWRFQPLALLTGRVNYRLEISGPTLDFRGTVGPTLGGGVRVLDAQGFVRIAAIRPLVPAMQAGSIDGMLDYEVQRLVLAPPATAQDEMINPTGLWPSTAAGQARVVNMIVPILGSAPVGDYAFDVRTDTDSNDVLVDYRDLKGALEITGSARIHPNGSFDRECSARARPGAPPRLAQAAPIICDPSLF